MRLHLFEFEDLSGFPDSIRQGMLDYLRFFLVSLKAYQPAVPLINELLHETKTNNIIDLCSGGGGPVVQISSHLKGEKGEGVKICLTDKFPNIPAFQSLAGQSGGYISYSNQPLDVTGFKHNGECVYTMFSAFHHFKPEDARKILAGFAREGRTVAIFDGGDKNLLFILGILLLHPVFFLLFTPLIRPFNWKRIAFTYVLPVIPLCTIWDGLVSIARLYTPVDMLKEARRSGVFPEYEWTAGRIRHPLGFRITYLRGKKSQRAIRS